MRQVRTLGLGIRSIKGGKVGDSNMKKLEEERGIMLTYLQSKLEDLDREYNRRAKAGENINALDVEFEKRNKDLLRGTGYRRPDTFVQGEENTLLDVLENSDPNTDSNLINESLSEEIKRSLSTLTEREREIIVLFFGLSTNHPLSLEEIGEKFNLTRERVRQIKDKALQRLRHTSRSKILKSYLG
jgi:RNA polymerase primary sigma factor